MITCAIVEDAEKEIKVLKNTIQGDNRFSLYTRIINAENFTEVMSANRFDLLFVDVELGNHNVFELLNKLAYKPVVVVISNYPKYAMQAFENDVVHYIQKPIKAEHALTAIERAYKRIALKEHKPIPDSFFLQTGRNKYQQLLFNDITHVNAEGEYIKFNLAEDKPVMVYQRLKHIIPELPSSIFLQVHRSVVVNTKFIKSIDGSNITLTSGDEVTIGASYKKQLISLINR